MDHIALGHRDYYYELKEMREERERQILGEKLERQREKEESREYERAKEKEPLAAYKSFKRDEKQLNKTRLDPLIGQDFKVFCSDYIDHFYVPPCPPEPDSEADMAYGDIYLDSITHGHFGPFRPPKRASREAVKVKTTDGRHELSFKFIGNGYLKVPWEFISTARRDLCPPDPPLTTRKVFKFVGIRRDWEKEKAKPGVLEAMQQPRYS
ncbi:hypothetical protein MMYC01_200438 [Madurella mycetomatis]|uniref:Uncharacterized protein n=1 Tax=Madurella mycetomatis TaxID=100816 RepID=A0A175WHC0_9PEZI|nr:hypothetical protein MMYC01_200438 [Madurella mycetomatis]